MKNKIFENILSFKKEIKNKKDGMVVVYRKITILGIKIKIKLYEYYKPLQKNELIPDWLVQYWLFFWNTSANTQIGKMFELSMQNLDLAIFYRDNIPPRLQLMLISLFLEDGSILKAQHLINKYMQEYGEKDLHEYLLIANYLVENNLTNNPKIINANKLYEIFSKSEKEDVYRRYLEGKTVAIVGNSPCEIGKNRQLEIDSCDVVVRFNNYSIDKKYTCDYGSKTTIWAIGISREILPALDEIEQRSIEHLKFIDFSASYKRYCFYEEITNKLLEINEKYNIGLISRDAKFIGKMLEKYNLNFVTNGTIMLEYAMSVAGDENVRAFGFSFLEKSENRNGLNRYFAARDEKVVHSYHNFEKETKMLENMFLHNKIRGGVIFLNDYRKFNQERLYK